MRKEKDTDSSSVVHQAVTHQKIINSPPRRIDVSITAQTLALYAGIPTGGAARKFFIALVSCQPYPPISLVKAINDLPFVSYDDSEHRQSSCACVA